MDGEKDAAVEDGSERQELQGQCQVVWLESEQNLDCSLSLSTCIFF